MPIDQPNKTSQLVKPVILLAVSFLFSGGCLLLNSGFTKIQSVWELQRIPTASINALLPGEVIVEGEIARPSENTSDSLLTSKFAQRKVVYFRYLHQMQVGSGDDERWETLEDIQQGVDFYLIDDEGRLRVHIGDDIHRVDWSMPVTSDRREGDHHYREWVLRPGDQVTVLGWYQRHQEQPKISFQQSGPYPPFISQHGAGHEIQALGQGGIFVLWGGLAVLGLAVYVFCYGFAIHRILGYLSILSLVYVIALTAISLNMYRQDLQGLQARWDKQITDVEAEIAALADRHMLIWDGLDSVAAFSQLQSLPDVSKRRVLALKQSLEKSLQLARYEVAKLPASLLSPIMEIDLQVPAGLALLPIDYATNSPSDYRFTVPVWQWVATIVSAVLALVLTIMGLRAVRVKRWLENIPATKTRGVVWGINELTGKVSVCSEVLQGPLSQQPCVWFNYRVFERAQRNNKTAWKQIEQRSKACQFLLTDDAGSVLVDPVNADVNTMHRLQERDGDIRIEETSIRIQDQLYLLGSAKIAGREDYGLVICKGQADEPFIISNRSEEDVLLKQGRKGMLLLNLASSALMLSCLLLFTRTGNFSGIDFLATAMIATGYLFLLMLVFHYNDLVFLKHRIERAIANIEVVLQKRFDLLTNLLPVVSQYATHEKSLLRTLSQLRGLPTPSLSSQRDEGSVAGSNSLSARMAQLGRAAGQLQAVAENYPELKQHELMKQFMDDLASLENETGLMRDGYNDAVEIYQTRLQSFPDIVIARLFRFNKAVYGRME